jgi:hypothetical protein
MSHPSNRGPWEMVGGGLGGLLGVGVATLAGVTTGLGILAVALPIAFVGRVVGTAVDQKK